MVFLKAESIVKSYRSGGGVLDVLRGVDFEASRGDTVAIVGASGAGKSTLLNILGALDRPTSGDVVYDGRRISGASQAELAAFRNTHVGFVFQFHHLLPEFTAVENVMLPALIAGVNRTDAAKRAGRLLDAVGLGDRAGHRPGELSGGEQQRTALVRALVQGPGLVLADEPTGNLDAKTGEEVFSLLLEFNRTEKTTLVVVTHNDALARRMSRVLVMEDGKLRPQ